ARARHPRRRRLPDERAGARDGGAARHQRRHAGHEQQRLGFGEGLPEALLQRALRRRRPRQPALRPARRAVRRARILRRAPRPDRRRRAIRARRRRAGRHRDPDRPERVPGAGHERPPAREGGLALLLALADEPARAVAEEDVEGGQAAVAARDVALQLELLLGGQRGMAVELLLEHAELVANPDELLQEDLDGDVLGRGIIAPGNEPERSSDPALAELEVDVEPAVVAEDVAHRLRDAIEVGIAGIAVTLHALEAEGHAPGVAAREDDHVAIVVVGDDAAAAEVAMLDDAAETEARADRKSTRLNSSHDQISYAVFCLKKKNTMMTTLNSAP